MRSTTAGSRPVAGGGLPHRALRLVQVMVVSGLGLAVSGCGGTPTAESTVSVDGPIYSTVTDLAEVADVVVVGVVGEQLNDSGDGTGGDTDAYHRFAVDDVLAGG